MTAKRFDVKEVSADGTWHRWVDVDLVRPPHQPGHTHIGRVVESVWLRTDRKGLAFVFADGTQHVMIADDHADNLASAWIEHVDDFGFKGRFLGVGNAPDREDRTVEQHTAHDVLDVNFYDFRTESGRLLVELRTSSNGYYSGSLAAVTGEIGPDWKQVE